MELTDLINKPISECTPEELEERIHLLKSMRVSKPKGNAKKVKTNKERRDEDLLKKIPKDKLQELLKQLKEAEGG